MLKKYIQISMFISLLIIPAPSFIFAQDKPTEKKEEKNVRYPIVDTFTRVDQGGNLVDVYVLYGHQYYFAYKGIFDDAKKKYDMDKFHVFIVTINSSSKQFDIAKFKVESSVFLRTEDGLEYPSVPQWIPLLETPAKRVGVIRFFKVDANNKELISEKAKSFSLVLKELAGIPERTFKWDLPIEF